MQPQVPGQKPGECGDHSTISPFGFRLSDAAAQDCDLVPEYQDLYLHSGGHLHQLDVLITEPAAESQQVEPRSKHVGRAAAPARRRCGYAAVPVRW